jgi:hypothetical protein
MFFLLPGNVQAAERDYIVDLHADSFGGSVLVKIEFGHFILCIPKFCLVALWSVGKDRVKAATIYGLRESYLCFL